MPTSHTILIVEDEIDTRDVLARLLTGEGYNVRIASNGWEALLAMDKSPVDLILLDMMLPGLDGAGFLKSLRAQKNGRDVPVVVVTALDHAQVEPRVRHHNVSGILYKGGNLYPELKGTLHRMFARPRPLARVNLPDQGSLLRPYLDVYLKMLTCS